MLRAAQILEAMFAKISNGYTIGQFALDQTVGRLREQHLAAVRDGRDACRAMDIDAHVTRRADLRLASVQAHAHAHADVIRPDVGTERTLGLHCGVDSVHGAWEGNGERIALGFYDAPIVHLERLAQEPVVLGEQGCEFVAQLL
jgi:hypothetical protein